MELTLEIANKGFTALNHAGMTFSKIIDSIQSANGYDLVVGTPLPNPTNKELNSHAWETVKSTVPPGVLGPIGITDVTKFDLHGLQEELSESRKIALASKTPWFALSTGREAGRVLLAVLLRNFGKKIQKPGDLAKSLKDSIESIKDCKKEFVLADAATIEAACTRSLDFAIACALRAGRNNIAMEVKVASLRAMLIHAAMEAVPNAKEREKQIAAAVELVKDGFAKQMKETQQDSRQFYSLANTVEKDIASLRKALRDAVEHASFNEEQKGAVLKAIEGHVSSLWKTFALIDTKRKTKFCVIMLAYEKANY